MAGRHERRLSTAILGPGWGRIPQSEGTRTRSGKDLGRSPTFPTSTVCFPSARRLHSSSRPWPSLSVPLLSPSPSYVSHFGMIDDHDAFAPGQFINFIKRVWAASSPLPTPSLILCFHSHRRCPTLSSHVFFFSLSLTCLSSHLFIQHHNSVCVFNRKTCVRLCCILYFASV